MSGIDAPEPTLCGRCKLFRRVCNRKLRGFLADASVVLGEVVNEIVKGASKIVANLSDENPDAHGNECLGEDARLDAVRRIGSVFHTNRVSLLLASGVKPLPQISKVLACPNHSFNRVFETIDG